MNQAACDLASKEMPPEVIQDGSHCGKEDETIKLSAGKDEISLGESKSSGDNGFLLAAVLSLAGQEETLPSPFWSHKAVCGLQATTPPVTRVSNWINCGGNCWPFLLELPVQDFPTPILVGIPFVNCHRAKLALSKIIHLIFSLITCQREACFRIPFRYKFWCWGTLHDTFYGYHGQVHRTCLKDSVAYQYRQFSSDNNNKGDAS